MKDYFNKFPNILRQSAIFLFLILFLLLIYAPVFQGYYFQGEDYGGIWTSTWSSLAKESFAAFTHDFPFEGRPLKELYLYVVFIKYINPLKSVEAANTVRFAGVIGVVIFAYVLYLIFKENGFKTAHAFLLSILICTLPPVQIYVCRIAITVFLYGLLLSALSALVLFKSVFKEDRGKITHTAIAVLTSIALLVTALNIYQPAAMTYWSMLLIPLIMMKDKDFIKKMAFSLTIYFSVGFVSLMLYSVTTKITFPLLNYKINALATRGGLININEVFSKMIAFIKYPLYTALNLWNTFPSKAVGLSVGIFIIAGFVYSFRHVVLPIMKEKKGLHLLSRHLLILIVIPLSYLTHLLIREDSELMIPKFRILAALEITIVMLGYWGFMNVADFFKSSLNFSAHLKEKIITIALIILTVTAAFAANHNVARFVNLHSGELRYVKNVIQEYGVSKLSKNSRIYIISSDREATKYFSEFTYLTSMYRSSIPMVRLALYELGIDSDISVDFYEESDNSFPKDNNALIIKMADYQKKAYEAIEIPLTIQPLF